MTLPVVTTYIAIFAMIWVSYMLIAHRRTARNRTALQENINAGLLEPASLHPVIDHGKCLGCGACVTACPEGNVLGIIQKRAELINPTHCIGHSACKDACPFAAITLVFGTARRGIDIPVLKPSFETNVPGIYIAGELGGMGLIRNAIEQGKQAIDSIRKCNDLGKAGRHDVIIVGAGPAGFSASLAAIQHGLNYLTLEQDSLGGTVSHYPRGKLVMTAPVVLPLIGKTKFTETSKESLLEFWRDVESKSGVKINYHERMEGLSPDGDGFVVKTTRGEYRTRTVLLAIGRRGTPRKLDVPGEEQSKVVYRMIDPEQYRGNHVLIVGGGDSALEAATSIAYEPGASVTLSYRSESFGRAKEKNRQRVAQAEQENKLKVFLQSTVESIEKDAVLIKRNDELIRIDNDAVIVSAGGILPTPFLREIGITVETRHGEV